MTTIYLADVPTYAALLAAYPEKGPALAALPAGTRIYVEDMGCEVRRGPGGKWWVPERVPPGPRFTGTNAQWIAPAGIVGISTVTQSRKRIRLAYFKMPGFRPTTISRISLYQNTAGTVGAGTDSFALRFYPANPDGSPIIGAAPFLVQDWNAAGGGGAGVLSLANAGNNALRIHSDLPGGPADVPAHFWCGFICDLATAPNMGSTQSITFLTDYGPTELSGSDPTATLGIPRASGYQWDDPNEWAIGAAPVWPASGIEYTAANVIFPLLKVAA